MSTFLYFFPGPDKITHTDVVAAGLGYAFPSGGVSACGVTRGPGDKAGVVATDSKATGGRVGYYPDAQEWRPIPGANGAYTGWFTDARPGPTDLLRHDALPGHKVMLADGNPWCVPIACAWTTGPEGYHREKTLPAKMGLDPDGNWTCGEVTEPYRRLWDIACTWWDAMLEALDGDTAPAGDTMTLNLADACDMAVDALLVNYCIGRTEVAALGLFDDTSASKVMQAVIDWPTLLEFWGQDDKKKEPSAGSSSAGGLEG